MKFNDLIKNERFVRIVMFHFLMFGNRFRHLNTLDYVINLLSHSWRWWKFLSPGKLWSPAHRTKSNNIIGGSHKCGGNIGGGTVPLSCYAQETFQQRIWRIFWKSKLDFQIIWRIILYYLQFTATRRTKSSFKRADYQLCPKWAQQECPEKSSWFSRRSRQKPDWWWRK